MTSYQDRLDAYVDEHLPTSDYVPGIEAGRMVDALLRDDPELLSGWLHEQAPALLTARISFRLRSDRSRRGRTRRLSAFHKAADAFAETGDIPELVRFTDEYAVDEAQTRRDLGLMTRDEHLFVSRHRAGLARSNDIEARFHAIVASRMTADQITKEVFTEEELSRLLASLSVA